MRLASRAPGVALRPPAARRFEASTRTNVPHPGPGARRTPRLVQDEGLQIVIVAQLQEALGILDGSSPQDEDQTVFLLRRSSQRVQQCSCFQPTEVPRKLSIEGFPES